MFLPFKSCLSPLVRVISKIVVKRHKKVLEKVQVQGSEILQAINSLWRGQRSRRKCLI